jgi:protocatechuate 3,4-dioxygenase alpha subunit
MSGQTPSQTIGPFFHYALPWEGGPKMVDAATKGERILVTGRVLDGTGAPVPDAMIEVWQANAAGRYAHAADDRAELAIDPDFIGFGRSETDKDGIYRFETIRPGRVPGWGNALQAPHLAVGVFGRGLLKRLVTRIYFEDSAENAEDPVLDLVEPARRHTLIARREQHGAETIYRLDIVLQGPDETVFFDC